MSTTPEQVKNSYPLPGFRFIVSVGKDRMAFNSVSGLDLSFETIEYKDGTGGHYQMPGQRQALDITLKRGIVLKQSQLFDWISSVSLNQIEKKDISISMTNAAGTDLYITWNVVNAFPTKLTGPSLDANGNDVALEEIVMRADRMSVEFH